MSKFTKVHPVYWRLDEPEYRAIKEAAARELRSVNDFIRVLIRTQFMTEQEA